MEFSEKGFITKTQKLSEKEINGACEALTCGDWTGAWLFLSGADEHAPPAALYHKALCLRRALRHEEALAPAAAALRSWELAAAGLHFKPDSTAQALMVHNTEPPILNQILTTAHPAYAAVCARALLVLCLAECGRSAEAEKTAEPLVRYGFILRKDAENKFVLNIKE